MNKILSTEVVEAIADAMRQSATQPQGNGDTGTTASTPDSTSTSKTASGVMLFIADLLSNSALSRFLGGGRPEAAVMRGSVVGLASGVEAVTDASASGNFKMKQRPLVAVLTVSAYVVGGITAALIFRGMRRSARTTVPSEM